MRLSTNALLAASALASVTVVGVGAAALLRQAEPEPALMRVVRGTYADCNGFGLELVAGRDLDRNGELSDDEAEVSGIACGLDGGPELVYDPEPLPSRSDRRRSRRHAAVLLEFADEPAGSACAEGGLNVSVGLDRDRNAALSAAEISKKRVICRVPALALRAASD
jgi:hypothetical protein